VRLDRTDAVCYGRLPRRQSLPSKSLPEIRELAWAQDAWQTHFAIIEEPAEKSLGMTPGAPAFFVLAGKSIGCWYLVMSLDFLSGML
jgi:hypothetical protein